MDPVDFERLKEIAPDSAVLHANFMNQPEVETFSVSCPDSQVLSDMRNAMGHNRMTALALSGGLSEFPHFELMGSWATDGGLQTIFLDRNYPKPRANANVSRYDDIKRELGY